MEGATLMLGTSSAASPSDAARGGTCTKALTPPGIPSRPQKSSSSQPPNGLQQELSTTAFLDHASRLFQPAMRMWSLCGQLLSSRRGNLGSSPVLIIPTRERPHCAIVHVKRAIKAEDFRRSGHRSAGEEPINKPGTSLLTPPSPHGAVSSHTPSTTR